MSDSIGAGEIGSGHFDNYIDQDPMAIDAQGNDDHSCIVDCGSSDYSPSPIHRPHHTPAPMTAPARPVKPTSACNIAVRAGITALGGAAGVGLGLFVAKITATNSPDPVFRVAISASLGLSGAVLGFGAGYCGNCMRKI